MEQDCKGEVGVWRRCGVGEGVVMDGVVRLRVWLLLGVVPRGAAQSGGPQSRVEIVAFEAHVCGSQSPRCTHGLLRRSANVHHGDRRIPAP